MTDPVRPPHRQHYNVSRLDEFSVCPQKYDYRYEQGWEGMGDREALDFGSAIHSGLQGLYKGQQEGTVVDPGLAFDEALPEYLDAERGYGKRLLDRYQKRWDGDRTWKVLMVEKEFAIQIQAKELQQPLGLFHPHYILHGRYDLVVEEGTGRTVYHVQHKTVGSTVGLDNYVRKYDLNWHERLYSRALQHVLPFVGGTIINLLRKSRPNKNGVYSIKDEDDFKRYYLPCEEDSLKRFERDCLKRISEIESDRRTGIWPQAPGACLNYNRLCQYHGICLGMPVEMEELFQKKEADYVDMAEKEEHVTKKPTEPATST